MPRLPYRQDLERSDLPCIRPRFPPIGRSLDYPLGKICTSKISLKRCLDCLIHMNVQICPASGLVFLLYINTYGRSCLDYLIGKISLKRCLDCLIHMNVQICPASGLVFLLYISTYGRSCFDYLIGKICTSKISLKRCLDYLLSFRFALIRPRFPPIYKHIWAILPRLPPTHERSDLPCIRPRFPLIYKHIWAILL